jgi:hypothetical protein
MWCSGAWSRQSQLLSVSERFPTWTARASGFDLQHGDYVARRHLFGVEDPHGDATLLYTIMGWSLSGESTHLGLVTQ